MTSYMVPMWSRRAERGRALELLYCLNHIALTKIKNVFWPVKSDFGLRPVHHRLARRTRVHLFIAIPRTAFSWPQLNSAYDPETIAEAGRR